MITSGLHQMKLCSRCKEKKELTKFYKRIVSKDGLTASCRDCLGKKRTEEYVNYKKTLCCTRCGTTDYRVLEFHHIKDKTYSVATMVSRSFPWKEIKKEISKCIPLCANCHRLEHYGC